MTRKKFGACHTLIIACDSALWSEYDVSAVAAEFWKIGRVRNMRAKRKDKGTKRRKTDVSDVKVPSNPESVPDEAPSNNLSDFSHSVTQVHHHHQVPAPLPLQMEALVQGSLIDHGDHCDMA